MGSACFVKNCKVVWWGKVPDSGYRMPVAGINHQATKSTKGKWLLFLGDLRVFVVNPQFPVLAGLQDIRPGWTRL